MCVSVFWARAHIEDLFIDISGSRIYSIYLFSVYRAHYSFSFYLCGGRLLSFAMATIMLAIAREIEAEAEIAANAIESEMHSPRRKCVYVRYTILILLCPLFVWACSTQSILFTISRR